MQDGSELIEAREGNYTCFTVDGEEYALLTEYVMGVQGVPVIRRVPKSPDFIEGVANIRGRIMPVINASNRLATSDGEKKSKSLIITQVEGAYYGLLADEVIGNTHLEQAVIEPVNPVLVKKETPFILAMAAIDDRLVHLLDLDALFFAGLNVNPSNKAAFAVHVQQTNQDHQALQISKHKDSHQYLIMQIGQESYALPVHLLREVLVGENIEKISAMPDYIAGIVRTHGLTVPVVDMQIKFGLKPVPYESSRRVVVVDAGNKRLGIVANSAWEMIEISASAMKSPPKSISVSQTTHIKQVAVLDNGRRMLIVLDPVGVLTARDYKTLLTAEGLDTSLPSSIDKVAKGGAVKSYLIFQVAGYEFAFNIDHLSEVVSYLPVNRIPKAPAEIRGLVSVKGELVPVTDLRVKLNIKSAEFAAEKYLVVVNKQGALYSVIADKIVEILQVSGDDLLAPETVSVGIDADVIEAVIRLDNSDRVPMTLNFQKIF